MKRFITLAMVLLACLPLLAQDLDSLINNRSHTMVSDLPNILSTVERKKLETKLVKFDQETSAQIAIVLIRNLQGRDLEEVSLKLFNSWGIGQKDKNNGLLILAAVNDRKVRIEVGTGLEAAITDEEAARIIREDIVPEFRNTNYYEGLNKAANSLMVLARKAFPAGTGSAVTPPVSGEDRTDARPAASEPYSYELPEGPAMQHRGPGTAFFIVLGIGMLVIVVVVYIKLSRRKTEGLYTNENRSLNPLVTAGSASFLGGLLAGWFLFGNRGRHTHSTDDNNDNGGWPGNTGSSFDNGSSPSDSGSSSFDAGGGFDGGSSSGGGASGDW